MFGALKRGFRSMAWRTSTEKNTCGIARFPCGSTAFLYFRRPHIPETKTPTQHLNSVDDTGTIKFTAEQQQDEHMPFLDTLIVRKTDGRVKLLDQYLHFSSHHPLQHKPSVVRTLLDRSSQIVTEEEDRKQEEHHIRMALTRCGYHDWSINQVKSQMLTLKTKKTTRKRIRQLSDEPKSTVVIHMYRTYQKL